MNAAGWVLVVLGYLALAVLIGRLLRSPDPTLVVLGYLALAVLIGRLLRSPDPTPPGESDTEVFHFTPNHVRHRGARSCCALCVAFSPYPERLNS